jgi:hypothetical protein
MPTRLPSTDHVPRQPIRTDVYDAVEGDVITYTIVVDQHGNVTLTDIAVSRPVNRSGCDYPGHIASLAPGATVDLHGNLHHYSGRPEQRQRS